MGEGRTAHRRLSDAVFRTLKREGRPMGAPFTILDATLNGTYHPADCALSGGTYISAKVRRREME